MLYRFDSQQDVVEALMVAQMVPAVLTEATESIRPVAQGLMTTDALAEAMGKFMVEHEDSPGMPLFEAMVETTAVFVGALGFATHGDENKALSVSNEFIDSVEFFRMVNGS